MNIRLTIALLVEAWDGGVNLQDGAFEIVGLMTCKGVHFERRMTYVYDHMKAFLQTDICSGVRAIGAIWSVESAPGPMTGQYPRKRTYAPPLKHLKAIQAQEVSMTLSAS